jgi:hypothetical protein
MRTGAVSPAASRWRKITISLIKAAQSTRDTQSCGPNCPFCERSEQTRKEPGEEASLTADFAKRHNSTHGRCGDFGINVYIELHAGDAEIGSMFGAA